MGENTTGDTAQIMHSLGQLTGAVSALQQGLTARIEDIRGDIRRIETTQSARLDRVETNLTGQIDQLRDDVSKRIDGLDARVNELESGEKSLIEKTAGLSAISGTIGGALTAAAVELIKRM